MKEKSIRQKRIRYAVKVRESGNSSKEWRKSSANEDSMNKSNKKREIKNRGETSLKEDLVARFCSEEK